MQGGSGPRFGLEAGFLIAVAIAAGLAELRATAIVAVMAGAWLLVCLCELAGWADGPRFRRAERTVVEEPAAEPDEVTDPKPIAAATESRGEGEGA